MESKTLLGLEWQTLQNNHEQHERNALFIKLPPSENEAPLSQGRVVLGWIALIIFIICFAPNPLEIVEIVGEGQVIGT